MQLYSPIKFGDRFSTKADNPSFVSLEVKSLENSLCSQVSPCLKSILKLLLTELIVAAMAMEILLGAENITADEACKIGLVNKVVSLRELIPTVKKLATSIIKNAPIAIAATINSVNSSSKTNLRQGLTFEQKEFSKLFTSKDTKEGLSAFVEKRSPNFTGE